MKNSESAMNREDKSPHAGTSSVAAMFILAGVTLGPAFTVLSCAAFIIACISVSGIVFGIVALRKTRSGGGKAAVSLSMIVLVASSLFAVIFLIKSQQAELQEALFQAAAKGNKVKVKELVAKGANINKKRRSDSYTLLHMAIEHGNNQMVEALLAGGADVNIDSFNGLTPMQLLLDRSVNPWQKRKNFNYDAAAGLLLAHGATFNFREKDGRGKTCVQRAISNNQNEMLKLMLENSADTNLTEEQGSYLHIAIKEKATIHIIQTLVEAGTDVNVKDGKGNSPLHLAAHYGRKDIVEALLQNGADIDATNNKGMTALSLAKHPSRRLKRARQAVIELLQQKEKNGPQGWSKPDQK